MIFSPSRCYCCTNNLIFSHVGSHFGGDGTLICTVPFVSSSQSLDYFQSCAPKQKQFGVCIARKINITIVCVLSLFFCSNVLSNWCMWLRNAFWLLVYYNVYSTINKNTVYNNITTIFSFTLFSCFVSLELLFIMNLRSATITNHSHLHTQTESKTSYSSSGVTEY